MKRTEANRSFINNFAGSRLLLFCVKKRSIKKTELCLKVTNTISWILLKLLRIYSHENKN